MWIRVESFTPPSIDTPSAVLNLFAGRVDDQGILLTLGRKTGDITFANDKSVSRQHCVIKVQDKTGNRQLVVENEGKAGTYIAERQVTPVPTKTTSPGHDMDSDATDDEGVVSQHVASQKQLSSLGSGTVIEDFPVSKTIQDLWKEPSSKLQMVKIDVGESRILDFQPHHRSILMQVGLNGSTLHLFWVPFHITFSRVPKQAQKDWTAKLPLIGATEDPQITSTTTHLVTAGNVSVSAKPLTACCRAIPIVTPDYLQALLDYTTSTDPPPSADNYKAPFDSTMNLLERQQANPKLMQQYVVLTLEAGEMEPLFQFSGATVVPLHELPNDQERLNRAKELVETSNQRILILVSRKRLFSKITALDGVHAVKPETWAKAIITQSAQLKDVNGNLIPVDTVVDEKTSEEKVLPLPEKRVEGSDTEDETPALSRPKSLQTQEESGAHRQRLARKRAKDIDSPPASPVETLPLPELQAPPAKRRRRGEQATKIIPTEEHAAIETSAVPQDQDEASSQEFTLRRRRTNNLPSQGFEASQSQSASKALPKDADLEKPIESPKPQQTHVPDPQNQFPTRKPLVSRSQSDSWFVVAPKDDATRKALWEKASMANADRPDGGHFKPPALSQPCSTIAAPSSSTNTIQSTDPLSLRGRRTNGPDFRRFRKNIVPRLVDESELIIVQAVHAKESQQQLRLQENQRELEKQQRQADELFREIGGGTTRRRRR